MEQDVCWLQRFDNFQRAFLFLQSACQQDAYSQPEAAGLIQSFPLCFELAWKTLKDYLTYQGIALNSPREVLKEAFRAQLVKDGHLWIERLDKRNALTHTYDEESVRRAVDIIQHRYLVGIKQVYIKIKSLI